MLPCANCQVKEAQRLCGACQFVPYCGEECAERHWAHHSLEAHLISAMDEMREPAEDEILPGLWLGGIKALHHLQKLNIGAVVTAIQHDKPGVEKMLTKKVGDRPDLRLKWYDSPDQTLTLQELERAASFIEQYLKDGVLVHCWAGHSRSVSIVLFYLMKKTGRFKTIVEALAFVKKKRPFAQPNSGFIAQLQRLLLC